MEKSKAVVRPKKTDAAGKGASAPDKKETQQKRVPTSDERIASFGEDAVIAALSDGKTMTATALGIGVSVGQLSVWLSQDLERSARAREARSYAARIWDEKAEDVIYQAMDPFELNRAKELAHHYRWRAAKIAPKDYGDKVTNEHTGQNGGAIQVASTVTFVRPSQSKDD